MKQGASTIAILSSGGDAPGMNAAIRAAVRGGLGRGCRMLGVLRGYQGLIDDEVEELELRSVSDVIHRGGTMLYTARSDEFVTPAGQKKALDTLARHGADALIVVGGDGSFRGALDLARQGMQIVGIPGTIDNDIACSEYTIGYDTAVNTAIEMIDRLRDTAQSHERCSVIEVMGRHCGNIALSAGIATGATAILVPEIDLDYEKDVLERIAFTRSKGKRHFIVVASEGIFKQSDSRFSSSEEMSAAISQDSGIPARTTVLGHVQRGGSPTGRDRITASEMGYLAAELLATGRGNRILAVRAGRVCDLDVEEALSAVRHFDFELYRMSQELSL